MKIPLLNSKDDLTPSGQPAEPHAPPGSIEDSPNRTPRATRRYRDAPMPSPAGILHERLMGLCWFAFPFVVLVLLAATLYFSFSHYYAYAHKNGRTVYPDQERLDLTASDANHQFLTRYSDTKGGPAAIHSLEDRGVRFYGLVTIDGMRFLFESEIVQPSSNSEAIRITFNSEGRSFDYALSEGRPRSLGALSAHPTEARLQQIGYHLAELLGGFINPMHAAIIEPEKYRIETLERTRLGVLPVIAATVSQVTEAGKSQPQLEKRAVAYIDESSMQTVATITGIDSTRPRNYRFLYKGSDEAGIFPDEVKFSPNPGEDWELMLNWRALGPKVNLPIPEKPEVAGI